MGARTGRKRPERGAALVEAAIVIPLLLLFVFGIIDFGAMYSNRTALNQGVRDGTRQGVVANFGTSSSCTITGSVPAGNARNLTCLVKERVTLKASKTRVKIVVPTSYAVGEHLLVCAEYPIEPVTPLTGQFFSKKVIRAKATMRIEQVPTTALVSSAETALDSDWSWCTSDGDGT